MNFFSFAIIDFIIKEFGYCVILVCKLIEEAEQPDGDLVGFAFVGSVARIEDVGVVADSVSAARVYNAEPQFVVDHVYGLFPVLVHLVVLPQGVDEECLHHFLRVGLDGIEREHQVGVVHHHFGRLLGERLAHGVDDVDKSGVGEILDVVGIDKRKDVLNDNNIHLVVLVRGTEDVKEEDE